MNDPCLPDNRCTVIIGASTNPERYAYRAAHMLEHHDVPFTPVGIKKGEVAGREIIDLRDKPQFKHVDTVTMYIGPRHQPQWVDYILSLNPKRIIFNPGTENPDFAKRAETQGVEVVEACTLVMLSIGAF